MLLARGMSNLLVSDWPFLSRLEGLSMKKELLLWLK